MNWNNLFWVLINTNWSFIKVFDTLEEAKTEVKNNPYATPSIIQCYDIYDRCNYCNRILYDGDIFMRDDNYKYCSKCNMFLNQQWSDGIIQ